MAAERDISTRLSGFDPATADVPLVELLRKINSAPWARTFGCCAGPAAHSEEDDVYGFYIALAVKGEPGARKLRAWVGESDRRASEANAAISVREVEKHGLAHLDKWRGFHLSILWQKEISRSEMKAFSLKAIRAMEAAWVALFRV